MELKVVFLTYKCSRGAKILRQLKAENISIDAIVIESPKLLNRVRISMRSMTYREILQLVFRRLLNLFLPGKGDDWLTHDFYRSFSNRVYTAENFNGKQCETLLRSIGPDIIVLGCSRIIRENIINIPKIGTLNAHPGLLPKYRGVYPIRWAIYNGDEIGVTVHFIDKGVDTGPILAQRIMNIEENDNIHRLVEKCERLSGELMAEVLVKMKQGQPSNPLPQSKVEGKQYYKMSGKLRREVDQKLRMLTKELKRTKRRDTLTGKSG
jgi:methionyl-tRNA formyltransferase